MIKPNPEKWERASLKIKSLKPHPCQKDFYTGTTTGEEDAAFREVIRREGQRDPIHVMPKGNKAGLPPGTVLDGMRRVGALRALGKEEVDAYLRHDLVDAEPAEVEATFMGFNKDRRQLHPLDKARVVLRLFEIEKGRPCGKLRRADEDEARDRVGKAIGMSGRNLQRYFRLLQTPREVQDAVRDGKLPLVKGEQVEGLPKEQQEEIAARIRAGEEPRDAVREYLAASPIRRKAVRGLGAFLRDLGRAVEDLDGRVDEIRRHNVDDRVVARLLQGKQLIEQLIAHGQGSDDEDDLNAA